MIRDKKTPSQTGFLRITHDFHYWSRGTTTVHWVENDQATIITRQTTAFRIGKRRNDIQVPSPDEDTHLAAGTSSVSSARPGITLASIGGGIEPRPVRPRPVPLGAACPRLPPLPRPGVSELSPDALVAGCFRSSLLRGRNGVATPLIEDPSAELAADLDASLRGPIP